MCFISTGYCDGVYEPHTGELRVKEHNIKLWTQKAPLSHTCWACSLWRWGSQRSSSDKSGWTEQRSNCALQAPAEKPLGLYTAETRPHCQAATGPSLYGGRERWAVDDKGKPSRVWSERTSGGSRKLTSGADGGTEAGVGSSPEYRCKGTCP